MTELAIRTAEHSDLPDLLKLYLHLNPEDTPLCPQSAATILAQLQGYPGSCVLVGLVGSMLATSCTLVVIPNLTRAGMPYALIENVVTHADYRNRGFGKAILAAAVERAWDEGCYKAMLMTGSKEPATLAFYEAAGFERSKTAFQVRRVPTPND